MTISLTIACICGAKERVEIDDDEELPELCRTCGGREATPTPRRTQGHLGFDGRKSEAESAPHKLKNGRGFASTVFS